MPSLVAGSASGLGSCIQNPLLPTAVTTPGTAMGCCPDIGEMCARPWMSRMRGPAPPVEFCGLGATAVKSVLLVSVSVAPPPTRVAEVVFDRPGAGAAPSYEVALLP